MEEFKPGCVKPIACDDTLTSTQSMLALKLRTVCRTPLQQAKRAGRTWQRWGSAPALMACAFAAASAPAKMTARCSGPPPSEYTPSTTPLTYACDHSAHSAKSCSWQGSPCTHSSVLRQKRCCSCLKTALAVSTWGMAAPTAFATEANGGRMRGNAPSSELSHKNAAPPTTTTVTSPVTQHPPQHLLIRTVISMSLSACNPASAQEKNPHIWGCHLLMSSFDPQCLRASSAYVPKQIVPAPFSSLYRYTARRNSKQVHSPWHHQACLQCGEGL